MKENFEKKYHDLERDHWWFRSRRKYILDLLRDFPRDSRILDIGSSSGLLMMDLIDMGFEKENIYGIDISETAIENCKLNGLDNCFVMDAQNITIPEKFDVLIASDCLEHLEDDKKALHNWNDLLKDNGYLLVFVPAFMSLWSNHDVVNMHFHRYTKKELKDKILQEKFEIKKASYWNFSLFTPVYLFRMINKSRKQDPSDSDGDLKMPGGFINSILTGLVTIENKLLRIFNFPVGVSTFCIAKKLPSNRV